MCGAVLQCTDILPLISKLAESNVYARESGYSNAIENPSIIGIAPEFVYTDGLEVEEVTVKFELDDSIVDNTLGTYVSSSTEFEGIKRLNVFMFFEDVNMLLPVETFHDEATNTVYTTTDRMGTYCLVDMELWLDNLGIVPEITEPVEVYSDGEVSVYTDYAEETEVYASGQKYKDNFDVAFLIDARMETNENYANSRRSILEMCDIILTVSPNARIRFIQLLPIETSDGSCYNVLTHGRDNVYFTDYDTICESLSNFEPTEHNTCYVAPGLEYVIDTATRETFCFYILEKDGSKFDQMGNDISNIIGSNVTISVVSDYKDESKKDAKNLKFIPDMCNKTGGQILSVDDEKDYEGNMTGKYNFKNRGLGVIYGCTPKVENSYKAIIATGYETIELKSSLLDNYNLYQQSKTTTIPYMLDFDTDEDGLSDYYEIMFDYKITSIYGDVSYSPLITMNENGDLVLPTFDYITYKVVDLAYVEKGLERYCQITGENAGGTVESLNNVKILPIISDPTSEDGDEDGAPDSMDSEKLKKNINDCFFEMLVKKGVITNEDLIESGDGLIICKKPLSEIIFDCCGSDVELKSNVENIHSYDNNEIEELFSCWYIVMVKTSKGVAYSGIKVITNDDLRLKISSVSFKSFNPFEIIMYNEIEEKKNGYIQNELYNMTAKEKRSSVLGFAKIHDPVLYDYYFGFSSIGEYFIADFCVERIIKDATDKKFKFLKLGYEDGKNYIQFEYNIDEQRIQREFYTIGYDKYSIPTLIKHTITKGYSTIISRYTTEYNIMEKVDSVKDGKNAYDIYRIYINDINNLSTVEKNCIIAAFFGNECYSSYAAEISIHADGLLGISPISNIRYSSVLVADMTCYESSIESDMYINMVDYTNMQSKKYGGKYDC